MARDDPLDTYLVHNPSAVLDKPVEATVIDPTNPYVLGAAAGVRGDGAAADRRRACRLFGGAAARRVVDDLVADGMLRKRPTGWFWTSRERPHHSVDIRGSGGDQVAVVEADSGRMLGTVDPGAACTTVHPGAVYLHQGTSYVVDDLDLESGLAMVHREDPEWSTSPREQVDISVLSVLIRRSVPRPASRCASARWR